MPFLAYVDAPKPDRPVDRRRPWEPNWRVWRWVIAALVVGYATTRATGAVQTLLAFVVFALCCRAALEAIPYGDGLREWRQ